MRIGLIGLFALGLASRANATTINFNDGVDGDAIGAFYAAQGVTFSNASWNSFACAGVCPDVPGLALIDGPPATFQPKAATPVVLTFSSVVNFVSIFGFN